MTFFCVGSEQWLIILKNVVSLLSTIFAFTAETFHLIKCPYRPASIIRSFFGYWSVRKHILHSGLADFYMSSSAAIGSNSHILLGDWFRRKDYKHWYNSIRKDRKADVCHIFNGAVKNCVNKTSFNPQILWCLVRNQRNTTAVTSLLSEVIFNKFTIRFTKQIES